MSAFSPCHIKYDNVRVTGAFLPRLIGIWPCFSYFESFPKGHLPNYTLALQPTSAGYHWGRPEPWRAPVGAARHSRPRLAGRLSHHLQRSSRLWKGPYADIMKNIHIIYIYHISYIHTFCNMWIADSLVHGFVSLLRHHNFALQSHHIGRGWSRWTFELYVCIDV